VAAQKRQVGGHPGQGCEQHQAIAGRCDSSTDVYGVAQAGLASGTNARVSFSPRNIGSVQKLDVHLAMHNTAHTTLSFENTVSLLTFSKSKIQVAEKARQRAGLQEMLLGLGSPQGGIAAEHFGGQFIQLGCHNAATELTMTLPDRCQCAHQA
jgi:hypothetical protein